MSAPKFDIVEAFQSKLKLPEMNQLDEIAAVLTLMDYLLNDSSTTTIQEFMDNMKSAQVKLCKQTCSVPVRTTCELFMRFITLSHSELENATNFQECKLILMKQGKKFIERIQRNPSIIIKEADHIIQNGMVLLTHSRSKLVLGLMTDAHKRGKKFTVYVTDGQPSCQGQQMVEELRQNGVNAEFIYDSEVSTKMENVDDVIVAAEGICEDGGAICRLGFYNIALIAKAFLCKVNVLAESHKFTRHVILSNTRLSKSYLFINNPAKKHPLVDFTPAEFISLVYSDVGTMPTSAVGEYLFDLYT